MAINQESLNQERFIDYLAYFGLSSDPFDPNHEPYFQGGKRRQVLSQLLHLCQFSSGLLVVLGEAGVGKSCLKRAVVDHLDKEDLACEIKIPVLTTSEQVLKSIVQQFKIAVVESTYIASNPELRAKSETNEPTQTNDTIIQSIHEFVASPENKDKLKVLLIEDAHNLDDHGLETVIKLAKPHIQSHRQLHVVLLGEPQLSRRLEAFESKNFMVKRFNIEPLDREELKAYLRFRLNAVGFDGIFPFKEDDLQFLWDISHGLPTAVHDAAREILIELATPPLEPKSLGLPVKHMALVIVLAAVLLAALFYRDENEQQDKRELEQIQNSAATAELDEQKSVNGEPGSTGEVAPPLTTPPLTFPPSTSQPSTTEPSTIVTLEERKGDRLAAVPEPAKSLDSKRGQPNTDRMEAPDRGAVKTETNQPARPVISDESSSSNGKPFAEHKENEDIAALSRQAADESSSAQQKRSEGGVENELSLDEQRLLAMAPEGFTLQILASGSEAAVQDYLRRQPNREELALFPTYREGKLVYVVVAGSFASSELARRGVADLPREQREAGPWPRSVQSVQADIRNFHKF